MRIQLTGLSFPIGGVQWVTVPGDKEVAGRLLAFLEDRRLLYIGLEWERPSYAVASALQARIYLTQEIGSTRPGQTLEHSMRRMRAACRRFVDLGGPHGRNFKVDPVDSDLIDPFGLALGDLRTAMGFEIALVASKFQLDVAEELATILPTSLSADDADDDDPQWLLEHFGYPHVRLPDGWTPRESPDPSTG